MQSQAIMNRTPPFLPSYLMANLMIWFGAIASWEESLQFWLSILASVLAVVVSIVTLYYMIKNHGRDKNK